MLSLSREELRSFLVKYHSLENYDVVLSTPKTQIKKIMGRIGSVQYDPLNVVGRNPDLVFQSRVKGYAPFHLEELLYTERALVDAWDKEMSIYLTSDWPYFSRIRRFREEGAKAVLDRRGQSDALLFQAQALDEIKNRGPLMARDIKFGACKGGRWGHRQNSGAALDFLYHSGKVGIHEKRNAQKVYNLIENLLPKKILEAPDPFKSENDFLEWYVMRRIGSIGAHWQRNGSGWLGIFLSDTAMRKNILKTLEEKKLIVPFSVPEINETFYIRKSDVSLLNKKENYDDVARILAPLDNMLWDRLMVKKIFDFEYTWEVYVPQEKRKFGYYVLPVLFRNRIIARFEPVKHEEGEPLKIKNWWREQSTGKTGKNKKQNPETEGIKKGLENFANYLNAKGIEKKSLQMALC